MPSVVIAKTSSISNCRAAATCNGLRILEESGTAKDLLGEEACDFPLHFMYC